MFSALRSRSLSKATPVRFAKTPQDCHRSTRHHHPRQHHHHQRQQGRTCSLGRHSVRVGHQPPGEGTPSKKETKENKAACIQNHLLFPVHRRYMDESPAATTHSTPHPPTHRPQQQLLRCIVPGQALSPPPGKPASPSDDRAQQQEGARAPQRRPPFIMLLPTSPSSSSSSSPFSLQYATIFHFRRCSRCRAILLDDIDAAVWRDELRLAHGLEGLSRLGPLAAAHDDRPQRVGPAAASASHHQLCQPISNGNSASASQSRQSTSTASVAQHRSQSSSSSS